MTCPSCATDTTKLTLAGHYGTAVTIDLCIACQAFWFDARESLQLTPASTLQLFARIGKESQEKKGAIRRAPTCPRCSLRLLATHDRQRDTPFEYWRCPDGHGRFITFFNFLREKSFIKTPSAAQLEALRQNFQTVNCSNCGAPIDLTRGSSCAHCGSPVAMLDLQQARKLITQLQDASLPTPIDPALPLNLLHARRDVEAAFASMEKSPDWWRDASSSGLVEASIGALTRWLTRGD
jgi:hypothetical protein